MKSRWTNRIAVVMLTVAIGALVESVPKMPEAYADGAMSANQYNTVPANTNACDSVTVTNASTFICSNDTWGVGMLICNDSASKVYLGIGGPAVSGKGIPLAPGEKTPLPYPSTGPVSGISTASASVTFCRGWKQ